MPLLPRETDLDKYYSCRVDGPGVIRILLIEDRGKRRERCHVRVPRYNPHQHQHQPDYFWCGEIARWKRGEQLLCDFHAGMVVAGMLPKGITQTGRWGNK